MKLTKSQINEMAQDLEAGMKIFINRKDLEIRTILDWEEIYGDTEFWGEELEKIEKEWTDYVVIEKLSSREGFRIMQDFIGEIDDINLQENLRGVLERKSPFANFKAIIETSEFREQWFKFKTLQHENYVKEMLEVENIEFE